MYIYWIEDGKRRGPSTVSDFISLLETGEITADTLCWHSGCSAWAPARELPALVAYFQQENEKEQSDKDSATPAETSCASRQDAVSEAANSTPSQQILHRTSLYLPHPADRLMARLADCSLYAVIVTGVCYLFHVPYSPYLQPGSLLFWLPMALLEALSIHLRLSTPGKAFFGIMLFTPAHRISLPRAFVRSFLALILGMGCMQPLLALFTLPLTLYSLKKRRLTSWDLYTGVIPAQMRPGRNSFLRIWLFIIVLLVNMQLCSYFMQPWLPDMLSELQSYWPEAAEMLRQQLPSL